MTTLEYFFTSLLHALSSLLPFSAKSHQDLLSFFLGWPPLNPEGLLWVKLLGFLVLLFFFRYDWLGIFSALLKSVVSPKSMAAHARTLDQQIVLFLILSTTPTLLLRWVFHQSWITPIETLVNNPITALVLTLIGAIFLHIGLHLNRRNKGLNHLQLVDGALIGCLSLFSTHTIFAPATLLWSSLAATHYHKEAIFKYSGLMITLFLGFELFELHRLLHSEQPMINAVYHELGAMNLIVITLVTLIVSWITLEKLQKSFAENTMRFFRNFNLMIALGYVIILLIQYFQGQGAS